MRISNQVGKQIVAFFIEVAGEGEDGDGAAVDALGLAALPRVRVEEVLIQRGTPEGGENTGGGPGTASALLAGWTKSHLKKR